MHWTSTWPGSSVSKQDQHYALQRFSFAQRMHVTLTMQIRSLPAELFRAWDEDGDGYVSKREFRRGLQLFGLRADTSECNKLYNKFDKDGDDRVEYRELYKMIRGVHKTITGRSPSPPESPSQPSGRLPALQSRPSSQQSGKGRNSPPQLSSNPPTARPKTEQPQPSSLSLPASPRNGTAPAKPVSLKPRPTLAPLPPRQTRVAGRGRHPPRRCARPEYRPRRRK